MNRVDTMLRDWRIRHVLPWIPTGGRVLDVGCFDARLFRRLGPRLGYGVGMDPAIQRPDRFDRYQLLPGEFPDARPTGETFDAITFLAVLEHVPTGEIDAWTDACRSLLAPNGLVVATVPSPRSTRSSTSRSRLRLMDGMEAGQHHGFEPTDILAAFRRAGFDIVAKQRFQLGLNNLFVMRVLPPSGQSA